MTQRIVFLRHGQTAYNAAGRFQGQLDIPLDATGVQQAESIAGALAHQFQFSAIFSSDLDRARSTAAALSQATGVPVTEVSGLREVFFGEWEGLTREEISQTWPALLDQWLDGTPVTPPGGESREDASQRFVQAVEATCASQPRDSVLAIVAHGTVIRSAVSALLGLGHSAPGHLGRMGNCEFAELTRHAPPAPAVNSELALDGSVPVLSPAEPSWTLWQWRGGISAAQGGGRQQ